MENKLITQLREQLQNAESVTETKATYTARRTTKIRLFDLNNAQPLLTEIKIVNKKSISPIHSKTTAT